ncbi:MAG TPA: DUF4010 domain-containing protein [Aeromicrobium sp.]|nr:DUF4010 domain-containing protein [Aeromicrobium sp.]
MDMEAWQSLAIALAIGLLIGAERERSKGSNPIGGIRTFALAAVLGNIAGAIPIAAGVALIVGIVAMIVVGYLRSDPDDSGITTEVALLLTVGLGILTHRAPTIAVAAAVVAAILLLAKRNLHKFVRRTVTDVEISDALKFFVAAFIVLPLLPTGRIGPYGVWVPQRIWLLVVIITAVGWLGYAATRMLGANRGLLITGLAGGFVSGTATIGALGARSRDEGIPRTAALAGGLMASVATMIQLVVLTTIAYPPVGIRLYAPAAAAALVLGLSAWFLSRRAEAASDETPAGRPFALVPALIIAAVISGVLLLATWLNDRYGASGATLATVAGSLADTHAAAIAVSSLARTHEVSVQLAVIAIALGLLVNTGSKTVAAIAGGRRFSVEILAWHLPAIGAFAATLLLVG